MENNPPTPLQRSQNLDSNPPLDLPVASNSETALAAPRMLIKAHVHHPGPVKGAHVKGAHSISDTFHMMGNKSPRPNSRKYDPDADPLSDLPPSDPPAASDDGSDDEYSFLSDVSTASDGDDS